MFSIISAAGFREKKLQTPILIAAELSSKGEKCSFLVQLLAKYVITIYALGSVHESSASESKPFLESLQRRNSRPG